jgi:cytochrome c oxidase subunit III
MVDHSDNFSDSGNLANGKDPSRQPKSPEPLPRSSHTPAGTGTLGMWLFLASLGMLFAASLVGYGVLRFRAHQTPEHPTVEVPVLLFVISTVTILVSSFTIHQALDAVRRERQQKLRTMLAATLALAAVFVVVQAPAMIAMIGDHFGKLEEIRQASTVASASGQTPAVTVTAGLITFLVLVHALHVIGGLVPLSVITRKAYRNGYDHENHGPVRCTAMYWHFLDEIGRASCRERV